MPGFGESFNPKDDPPDVGWYSNLYHEVFNSMPEFHDGCHIIGHHAGAVLGPDFALRYAGFVHSLLLVGPAILTLEERKRMAERSMAPFNIPVGDGSHLKKTWDYLIQLGVPASNLHLLQREALDHARAWQGRMQIHACVWAYDCAAAMERIESECKILALCARDDVLWPMFKNVESAREGIWCEEIHGGNFALELAAEEIASHFLKLVEPTEA